MESTSRRFRGRPTLLFGIVMLIVLLAGAAVPLLEVAAQTQGTRTEPTATPSTDQAPPSVPTEPGSGGQNNRYTSPTFGFDVTWDETVWSVENEAARTDYEGIQLVADGIIVFLEAYEEFAGNPGECLAEATLEIVDRPGVTAFQPVTSRDLPVPPEAAGEAALFVYTQTFEDGASLDIAEYVECRTLTPGEAVLEITVQTPEQLYAAGLPAMTALLASVTLPGETSSTTAATPVAATPVEGGSLGRSVPIQGANHIAPGAAHEPYTTTPPTSGPHWGVTADWGVSREPIPDEMQVHNLEHGGVMLQYSCDCPEIIALLERFADPATGYPVLVIAAPYPTMEADVALTAWGQILELSTDEVTADRVRAFVEAFIDQGPERIHTAELEAWRASDAPKP